MDFQCLKRLLTLKKLEYSYRFYSRNVSRRRSLRIINAPENAVASLQQNNLNSKLQIDNQNNNSLDNDSLNALIEPQYEKLEEKNSRLLKTLSLLRSRKLRERRGKMLVEGELVISKAIDADMKLRELYFNDEGALEGINYQIMKGVELFKISRRTMQSVSSSSPKVMGVFQRPSSVDDIKFLSKSVLPVTIICDNIRDPGNLGSIIKHAASVGCQSVLLIKGCADPWETKALKVGCGGHFHIPIINNIDWENISGYIPKQSTIFIADNSSDIEHWEETPKLINYDASPTVTKKYLAVNEHTNMVQSGELETLADTNLPCYLYSSVMFPRENIVLYVGGETHGVDARIEKLACDYGGKKVKIPLENSMDSLNSSFAMGIILYEIRRQLSEKQ